MYWQSIVADRWLDPAVIHATFSDVFGLPPDRVEVTDDVARMSGPIPPEPRILVEYTRRYDAFPLQMDVFLGGDAIERPVADLSGTLACVRALTRRLESSFLLGTGPIANQEQLRVAPDGTVDVVALDPDAFDDDRFIIVGARPFSLAPEDAAPARAS